MLIEDFQGSGTTHGFGNPETHAQMRITVCLALCWRFGRLDRGPTAWRRRLWASWTAHGARAGQVSGEAGGEAEDGGRKGPKDVDRQPCPRTR